MYVKGRDNYPEIVRITKGANEKHQWGETWHTDVSYNAVAIWDNRSVIHQGLTDFFPGRGLGYERIMDRIAIEGDRPN